MRAQDVVFEAMKAGALTADDVTRATGLNPGTVKACISTLKARGVVGAVSRGEKGSYIYRVTDDGLRSAPVSAAEDDSEDMPILRAAPADLVESAMRSRTPLELAWVRAA